MRAVAMAAVILLAGALAPSGPADAEPTVWIVSGPGATDPGILDWLRGQQVAVHVYEQLGMAAILAPSAVARALQDAGLDVHPNEVMPLHLDESVARVKADKVRSAVGEVRTGPTVLVIDTGVDSGHPDFQSGRNLAANVAAQRSPNGLVSGSTQGLPVTDMAGHGSHVAGIVAGLGEALGTSDPRHLQYQGVYGNGRVASFQASTEAEDAEDIGVDLQAAIEAFDWALQHQAQYDIRIISNSWGGSGELAADHPAAKASFKAYMAGMVVVFSAGNDGTEGSLNRHCVLPWVVCVAGGELDGTRASFSSMGRADGAPYDHPDITAPGRSIRSADPPRSGSVTGLLGNTAEGLYRDRSGTSMAAPHVAGAAALLFAANPELSPDQAMDILVETADPMSAPLHQVGAGYLNVQEAYNLAVRTEGVLAAFLAGQGVKYGGPATGDPDFAADPVSVGYDSQSGGDLDATLITGDPDKPWLLTGWLGWSLLAAACLLAVSGFTRPRAPRRQPAGDARGQ